MASVEAREHNVLEAPTGVVDPDDVRASVMAVLAPLSNEDFNRVRALDDQDVSASWMVFHLIDHEWNHTVRIREIRNAFRR